jgi:hypothetical protein
MSNEPTGRNGSLDLAGFVVVFCLLRATYRVYRPHNRDGGADSLLDDGEQVRGP